MQKTNNGYYSMKRYASLRYRLLSLVLVPLVLLSGTVVLLAYSWSSNYTYKQLFAKVNSDLSVARDSFSAIQTNAQRQLQAFADSAQLASALASSDTTRLDELVALEIQLGDFDFLNLLSANGTLKLTSDGWRDHTIRVSPLSSTLLESRSATGVVGIEVYEENQWQAQRGLNSDTIVLPLLDTPRAAPSERRAESRAMVIRSLQSVYNAERSRVAVLEAGVVLNRNYDMVDRIRDLVYGPGSLAPGSRGTVTVFLDDVRVTTNVQLADASRALGTRVSREVRDAVLERGETWIDRAFVVDDWYISAYEPILDVVGNRVGMLYAGYLEAPFRADLFKAIAVLSALVLAGSAAAAVAATFGARTIFAPIESITSVVRATARGEHRRIGPISTGNEIGELASQFDAMLDTVDGNRQRIERDAALLEEKVAQRTSELKCQNGRLQESIALLQQTRRQLATAEKLAALGELTAGVAHEINNPTAVILGNMDVLVADLGDDREDLQTEIDLIIEQVYRIRSITDRLLQYSRSAQSKHGDAETLFNDSRFRFADQALFERDEDKSSPEPMSSFTAGELIDETLTLLSHELAGSDISVKVQDNSTQRLLMDRQEFLQIMINLVSNAIQAIDSAGEITVTSKDHAASVVSICVTDNGRGIAAEHLPKVFDPFFTAGKPRGTGLGLSVSYGIARRHGGDLCVQSECSKGSRFTLTLPTS